MFLQYLHLCGVEVLALVLGFSLSVLLTACLVMACTREGDCVSAAAALMLSGGNRKASHLCVPFNVGISRAVLITSR